MERVGRAVYKRVLRAKYLSFPQHRGVTWGKSEDRQGGRRGWETKWRLEEDAKKQRKEEKRNEGDVWA